MRINKKKTKSMLLNTAKTRDFTPNLKIYEEDVELVEKVRLLGVEITSDLKWSKNTEFTTKRGYRKLWILRRQKKNGANVKELFDIYQKLVRSILEYSAVVWHAELTQVDSTNLERVQKAVFFIILGKKYVCYNNSLNILGIKTDKNCYVLNLQRKPRSLKNSQPGLLRMKNGKHQKPT